MRRLSAQIRLALLVLFFCLGLAGLVWLGLEGWLDQDKLTMELEPLGRGVYPVFVLFFVIGVLCWVPLTVLVLAGTALFGPWLAMALALAGLFLGASLSFLVGRVLGRDTIVKLLSRQATVALYLSGGFVERARSSLILMRAVGAPNNAATWLAAVTGVPYRVFVFTLFCGELTGMITTAFLGNRLFEVIASADPRELLDPYTAIGVLSALGTVGLIAWTQRLVRQHAADAEAAAVQATAPDNEPVPPSWIGEGA